MEPTLAIAPHPDDETFGCGAALAALAAAGCKPTVAFLTDGGSSHPAHPTHDRAAISNIRRRESESALRALGITADSIRRLNAVDGTLARLEAEAAGEIVGQLVAILDSTGATTLLRPLRRDGSSEHEAGVRLIDRAVAESGRVVRILEYPVWAQWNPLLLIAPAVRSRRVWRVADEEACQRKQRAIEEYRSQTRALPPETSPALPDGFAEICAEAPEIIFEP